MLSSFAAFLFLGFIAAQEPGSARLLASKHVVNQHLVQKRDITIEYSLYNIGESTAYDVNLDEQNFNKADFEFVSGFTQAHWDRIPPQGNVTHVLILQPYHYQMFNFTAARVSYRSGEGANAQVINGFTSAPGEGQIVETNQFNRLYAPHYADWITFLVMSFPTVGIPYVLWYRSKNRYDVSKNAKKV